MLTIQPDYTHKVFANPSFKSNQDYILDEDRYNEEKDFYEKQIDDFNEIINENYIPKGVKKTANVLKFLSEGILSGLAMAWATTRGAKILKSSLTRAAKSKTYKKAAEITQPLKQGIAKTLDNIEEHAGKELRKIGEKKSIKKFKNSTKNYFNNKKSGQTIAKVFNKFVKILSNGKNKISSRINKTTYEGATKCISRIFGVGAGIMTAYNAASSKRRDDSEAEY